jgi:hypothetical protein
MQKHFFSIFRGVAAVAALLITGQRRPGLAEAGAGMIRRDFLVKVTGGGERRGIAVSVVTDLDSRWPNTLL